MSFWEYAKNELVRAGLFNEENPEKSSPFAGQVLELMHLLEQQGHNRKHGANSTVEMFHRLAYGLPLMPLTGEPDEWFWVLPGALQQNKRCARVVRYADGKAWDNEAFIFEDPITGNRMITERSAMEITSWPYMPTSRIIQASSPKANATMDLPASPMQAPVSDPDLATVIGTNMGDDQIGDAADNAYANSLIEMELQALDRDVDADLALDARKNTAVVKSQPKSSPGDDFDAGPF